ncbi:MAG: rhomboid family intramembrane serine protease [Verrucomicrobia bacterium]|nr:rhomboid family intramembrane serine protease [Verrucomicrobiota bacterium]MBS0637592.1 rhomboid family intramembrane serine protease [Verrucomicrobiota bacterium]
MRLVWTSDNADQFRAFCNYLQAKSITFTTEEQVVSDWSSEQYGTRKYLLWITEEDQAEVALHWLDKYLANPNAAEFATITPTIRSTSSVTQYLEQRLRRPIVTDDEEVRKEFSGHIRLTAFIILLCSLIFLSEFYAERRAKSTPKQEQIVLSPIHKALLFDYPLSFDLANKIVLLYGADALTHPQDLPEPGRYLYSELLKHPAFMGYYPYFVTFFEKELDKVPSQNPPLKELTLFEKIRSGEVWRLISPVVLHADILHLFFNMIWVLLLGTQIEARIGSFRLLILMLISGVFSNIGQYLMSGPNFVGFSGIICAMATYIRARQQIAPWEAYQMSNSTFQFIMFFIGILALLSLVTFFLRVFQEISLPFAIANTAHLVGAITGYYLGKMRFFSWQLHR